MSKYERLIAEVNGSMAIEGMSLTKTDRERMLRYLKKPEDFGKIMNDLIRKHKAVGESYAG